MLYSMIHMCFQCTQKKLVTRWKRSPTKPRHKRRIYMLQAVPKPKYRRRIPKRVDRGKFSRDTRQKVLLRDNGACQQCNGIGTQLHHCMPKGRGGRGVYTNALTVCNDCHTQIHKDNSL